MIFWIVTALLVLIAFAFLLPAVLKRTTIVDATREQNIAIAKEQLHELETRFERGEVDQERYQATRDELELSLFNDLALNAQTDASNAQDGPGNSGKHSPLGSLWVLLLIPLIAVPAYLQLGNLVFTKQLSSTKAAEQFAQDSVPMKADGTPDLEKIAEKLAQELKNSPNDARGWYMLGRTNMLLQRYEPAIKGFEKAVKLNPNVENMLSLADALSMFNKGQLAGRPRDLVNRALTLEPQNMTALWLAGMAASHEDEFPLAIQQWQKVLTLIGDKPKERAALEGLIAEAKSRMSTAQQEAFAAQQTTPKIATKPVTTAIKGITVKISLADKLRTQVQAEDSVFIYAKAMNGPPMPLAALRKQVKDFPLEVVLDDSMAMMPNLKLSAFDKVIVGARVSKTGQPIPQTGDLFTEKEGVKLGDSLTLQIDQVYQQ